MPDVFTEGTQKQILTELRATNALVSVMAKGYKIGSWEEAFELGGSGAARKFFTPGDQLVGTYTVGGVEYPCPWDVLGFRDVVALVNGQEVEYTDAPIIQMHYAGHENVAFDPAEATVATEATAQAGVYYCGYDGTNYTMLNLATGDTVPYGSYTAVYKTPYNSVNAIRYGNSEWQYSWLRQYLNHSGTGWAGKQTDYDVLPNNAAAIVGFMSYIDSNMAGLLKPVKIKTKQAFYIGGALIETWDKLFPLSVSEMNMSNNNASPDDSEPLDYYKALLESTEKKATGTYPALIKYAVNNTTSAQYVRLRSAYLGSNYVWLVNASGNVTNYYPGTAYRVSPACALI